MGNRTREESWTVYLMVKEPRKYRTKAFTLVTMSMVNRMVKENLPPPTALHTQAIGLMVYVMGRESLRSLMAALHLKAHSSMVYLNYLQNSVVKIASLRKTRITLGSN